MQRFTLALLPLLLFTLVACADENAEYGETTEDALEEAVGPIDEELMQETGYWDTWNTNDDAYLDANEFGAGFGAGTWWNDWDANDDTYLDADEFNTGFANETWYNDGLFAEWDADADTRLSQDEWETGLFDLWDVDDDTYLYENEYNDGIFN